MTEKQKKILQLATMKHFVKKTKGWRILKTKDVDGNTIHLITTDMRTKEGKALLKKAYEMLL